MMLLLGVGRMLWVGCRGVRGVDQRWQSFVDIRFGIDLSKRVAG